MTPGVRIRLALSATPGMTRGEDPATPITINYDTSTAAFATALIAAALRPENEPAFADPLSAALIDHAKCLAASDATILIEGETGTGKEGIARLIHDHSQRRHAPMTAINCAAMPEQLVEAMLFGHIKGSFTGAVASHDGLFAASAGGTIFLDEIGDMPLALQAKMLRVLQNKEILPVGAVRPHSVDTRILAATNRNLAQDVLAGRFRADLYWRLNVVPLTINPLRMRPRDVPAIMAQLVLRHAPPNVHIPLPDTAMLDRIMAHSWPGNVRELENMVQRALILSDGTSLPITFDDALDTRIDPVAATPPVMEPRATTPRSLLSAEARAAEARAIIAVLQEVDGNRTRAAQRLGVSPRTLRARLADMRGSVGNGAGKTPTLGYERIAG
ncbi:MAG: sigma 54-interacting transcriptional regulator [Sphingopyxis sp.]|nr:sigma 54-interacting transcriptional regulator [Sphingopyxis sp.]